MHSISSKYRKPKGRLNKRRAACIRNLEKGKSSAYNVSADNKCDEISTEAVPSTSDMSASDVNSESNEYHFINNSMWTSLLQNVPCSDCNQFSLNILTHNSYGFSTKMELVCEKCKKSYGHALTSQREKPCRKFDINTKLTSAFLAIGRGHAALETFSAILGTPCRDRKTFSKCLENLCNKNETAKVEMLRISREHVRQTNLYSHPDLGRNNIIDITVSYDGTWHKRGHTSLYGIGIVIDIMTSLVVDFKVLSKYCHECSMAAKDMGEASPEFQIWKSGHSEKCQKNFDGSSGSMEMHAAYILWNRSISDCAMRYTTVLCDEECVNHVAKRLGTALQNKVKEWWSKNVTLGGRKQGSLTDATITKLQNFYRKAIVDNVPEVEKMKASIFATLFHCMSTDAKPMHSKCPDGKLSWCFYNRAKADNKVPGSHKSMKTKLSEEVVAKIMPVYQRLASNEILLRCVSGKPKMLMKVCIAVFGGNAPKDVFVSKKRINLAGFTPRESPHPWRELLWLAIIAPSW
ncbi:uncharacterized protein TNCV_2566491 [Trichonephila clavipes]|uniref:Mutator-like transposase domain-containing protein n=1 Tax=Trichonephila clavipes TaxID=2585209 RepID=A0A8X6WN08_TRICX|nr:uncharacterized protein TNCV_2566491 [Trichonephila clavipes]